MRRLPAPAWRRSVTPIALALLSLVVAIALWVAVTDAENPNRVGVFPGVIEVKAVNIPEGLAVKSITQPTVSFQISAAESTFSKLTIADFEAEVDLSAERRPISDQNVIPRIVSKRGDVDVIEITPSVVTVTLEQVSSKQVPVQVNRLGTLPQGFALTGVESNPPLVTVSGASSLIQLVDSAYADVNLTGLRASLLQQSPLTPRDRAGADIRGVIVRPTNADVRVNVSQLEVTLALTVVPPIQGSVADGYALTGIAVEPQALPVSGPLETLNSVGTITTDTIDVSGLRADLTRNVGLRLTAGLQTTRSSVTVRLKVTPIAGEMTFSVAPQATGVPEGLKASFQTAFVNVRVRGEIPTLRALQPGTLKATVSASGLEEGVHVLTPVISGPESVQVASVEPPQVVLVLRK